MPVQEQTHAVRKEITVTIEIEVPKYVQYVHHGTKVTVLEKNKGKHRDNCLCFSCEKWLGCTTRKKLFKLCTQFSLVSPVWECPAFELKDVPA